MPICRANGYGLLADVDSDGLYEYWARFDDLGNALTLEWLDSQVGDYQGVLVTVEVAEAFETPPDSDAEEMIFLSVTAVKPAEPTGAVSGSVVVVNEATPEGVSQKGAALPKPAPAPGPSPSLINTDAVPQNAAMVQAMGN